MRCFSEDFCSRFAGVARLYGVSALEKIANAHVCLIGLGGVGSWACEALSRSGICHFSLVDMDDICATNTNRQLHALNGNYGRSKADVLSERVRAINPDCEVASLKLFITPENALAFFEKNRNRFDIVVDAIDGARNKAALIAACVGAGIPLVSSGGCAGKCNCSRIEFGDLANVEGDTLLKFVRKELRSRHGFPKAITGKKMGIPVVFSKEVPLVPKTIDESTNAFPQMISPAGGKPRAGTAAFVTGAFGLALAQSVVENLLARK